MQSFLKRILALLVLGMAVYLMLEAKYIGEYEHALNMIDDDKRFPLWYPHELRKTIFGIELMDWRDYSFGNMPAFMHMPVLWGRSSVSSPHVAFGDIEQISVSTNAVCGIVKRGKDGSVNGVKLRHYFLFASDMPNVRFYYVDKSAYLADCVRHGIDGENLKTFDECYMRFRSFEEDTSALDVLKNPFVSGVSVYELLMLFFALCIWAAVFGRFFKRCIGRKCVAALSMDQREGE